jgi:hypothetical protein
VKITKYKSGRESYDFKISRHHFTRLISGVVEADNKCGSWWLPTENGEQLKLIVEDKNG